MTALDGFAGRGEEAAGREPFKSEKQPEERSVPYKNRAVRRKYALLNILMSFYAQQKDGFEMSNELNGARKVLIYLAIMANVIICGTATAVGLKIDYIVMFPLFSLLGGALIFISAYCSWRNMPKLRNVFEPAIIGVLLSVPIVISTYLAMLPSLPLADGWLAQVDAALGFDWPAFVGFVDARPWLASLLGISYQSFAPQLLLLPAALVLLDQPTRAYQMISAYTLIGLSAALVSIFFPAIGAFPYYEVSSERLGNINIYFGYFFLDQFHGVRNDPDFVFNINNAAGIITFPSVHAAVAALCIWAAWNVRLMRYPVLVLNLGMGLSAISHGSHYVVDIFAGIPLAFLCIAATCGLARLCSERVVEASIETSGQALPT